MEKWTCSAMLVCNVILFSTSEDIPGSIQCCWNLSSVPK